MKNNKLIIFIILSTLFLACTKEKETTKEIVKIPFSGTYSWQFNIPILGDQLSTNIFYEDSISYSMLGAVYTTNYTQILHSFDTLQNKLITVGNGVKNGKYFVMLFKDISDTSITIYKHECVSGITEAEGFVKPDDNTTADYGWNVYLKN